MRRKPVEKRYTFGDYEAVICGATMGSWGRVDPALRISQNIGSGLFDYTDIHFSQAKTRQTLLNRLRRFAASQNAELTEI